VIYLLKRKNIMNTSIISYNTIKAKL